MEILNKALSISYITSKIAITNLEVAIHELKLMNEPNAGKVQHRAEKMVNAYKALFTAMERNMPKENLAEVSKKIELLIDKCWE